MRGGWFNECLASQFKIAVFEAANHDDMARCCPFEETWEGLNFAQPT